MTKQFPMWADEDILTAQMLTDSQPRYAFKLTNYDKVSSAVFEDDPDLQIDIEPNATYDVEVHIFFGGSASAIIEGIWSVPKGATGLRGVRGPASTSTASDNIKMRSGSHNLDTVVAYGYRSSDELNLQYATETGAVTTGDSPGRIAYTWRQSTSSATRVRMGRGSWMRVTRIA